MPHKHLSKIIARYRAFVTRFHKQQHPMSLHVQPSKLTEPEEILALLKAAGWFPGRDVSGLLQLPDGYTIHEQALAVLGEFAGLQIGDDQPGIDCRRSAILVDPMEGYKEEEVFQAFSKELHGELYPIGSVDQGICLVAIDEREYVFLLGQEGWFDGKDSILMGRSFAEALNRILLGKAPLPFDPSSL